MILLNKFLRDESGATAIEYGLIAAGISVAIIAVVNGIGDKLNTTFTSSQDAAEVIPSGLVGAKRRRVTAHGISRRPFLLR